VQTYQQLIQDDLLKQEISIRSSPRLSSVEIYPQEPPIFFFWLRCQLSVKSLNWLSTTLR
jgi:hypothetical protein